MEHHKTCRSLGRSLWQQPSVGDVLRLLDRDRVMRTVLHFPQSRRLLPPEVRGPGQSPRGLWCEPASEARVSPARGQGGRRRDPAGQPSLPVEPPGPRHRAHRPRGSQNRVQCPGTPQPARGLGAGVSAPRGRGLSSTDVSTPPGLSQGEQDPLFEDSGTADLDGLYDPCFLLHLFSELTRPGTRGPGRGRAGRGAVPWACGAWGPPRPLRRAVSDPGDLALPPRRCSLRGLRQSATLWRKPPCVRSADTGDVPLSSVSSRFSPFLSP